MDLTPERLRELFEYSPDTGIFTFRASKGNRLIGAVAGYLRKDGYVRIKIDSRPYFAHRLAWIYATDSFPNGEIDHTDGDRSNNRFANLRDVSRTENGRNRCRPSNNKSGYQGVRFHPRSKRWQARMFVGGKNNHIGLYDTPEAAHAAYAIAAEALGFSHRHIYGEAS